DSDSDSDPDDDTFGNRFAKTGPVMFNDWTEEAEEEQEDPDLAFIWAGFQTVLEASPLHPTDIASPGITGTGTGPQPHEDDPALEEVDPLGQTPQHTPQDSPGERTGGGVWQEYLDELHHLPAGVESEGRDQAVQTLQDLITDTAFGGPFEGDIAAAHPLLLQHSPAYRTHFTAFQHTHTTRSAPVHHPDTDPERDGITAPVPDPVLREYWTTLATRPSSPPDTTSGRHTTAPGAETIPPGGPLTAGAEPGPTAGHPQDMDIDDGPQHAGEPTPAGPPSAPHGHPHPDTDTGSDDGRTGNHDAMDDQPHSPQAGTGDSDDEVQPSAWERYLDATATLPDGPSTQQLRQLLQSLIDGTVTLDRPKHNLLRQLPGYRDDGTAFISAYDEVKDQDADARAIHLSFTAARLGLAPEQQAYWTQALDKKTARERTLAQTRTETSTSPHQTRREHPRPDEDTEQQPTAPPAAKRPRTREITRQDWNNYLETPEIQEARRLRQMRQRFNHAHNALGRFRAYADYVDSVSILVKRGIPDWHLTDDAMARYRHWITILAHTPHGLNRTATELGDMLNPAMPLTEQAVHQLLTDTGHTLGPRTHIPGQDSDGPHTATIEQALTDAGLPLHDTDHPQELTPTGHLLISHWATHLTTTHTHTHPTPHTPETAHTTAHTIARQLANNPTPYIPSLTQWLLPPPTQAPTPTTQGPGHRPSTRVPRRRRDIPAPRRTTPVRWPQLPASFAVGPAFQKLRNTVDAFTRNPSRQLTTDNARAETVLLMSLGRARKDKPVKSAAYIGHLAVDSVDYFASMRIMGMFVAGGAQVDTRKSGVSFRELKDIVDLKGSRYQKGDRWIAMTPSRLAKMIWGQHVKLYIVSGVWAMMEWHAEGVFKELADAVVEIADQLQSAGMAAGPRSIAKLIWRDGRAIDEQAVMVDAILRERGVIEGHNPPPDGHVFYGRTVRLRPDRRTRAVGVQGIHPPVSGGQQDSKLQHLQHLVKEFKYNPDERLDTEGERAATALLISLKRTLADTFLTRHQYVAHLTEEKNSDYLLKGMFAAAGTFMLRRDDDVLTASRMKLIMALKGKLGKDGMQLTPREAVIQIWGSSLSVRELRARKENVAGIWAMMNWDDGGIFQALADAVVEIFAQLEGSEHTLDERERTIARNIWDDHRALDDQAVIVHAILRAKGMVQDEEPPAAVVQQISSQTTGPTPTGPHRTPLSTQDTPPINLQLRQHDHSAPQRNGDGTAAAVLPGHTGVAPTDTDALTVPVRPDNPAPPLTGSQQQPGSPTLYDQVAQYYSQLEQPVMPL
ncbi:hypothetical protein ACFRFD_39455, partial [Streptomyces sp. NPDC056632]